MNYFSLLFLFGGRPLPGVLRIISRADLSYIASLVSGFIPALKRRCLAVIYVIPSFLAISWIVRYSPFSFIHTLSVNVSKSINLLKICLVKTIKNLKLFVFFRYILVDYIVSIGYI